MRSTAIGMVSRVVSNAIDGRKINMGSIAADAFGNALGSSLAYESNSANNSTQEALLNAENRQLYIDTGYTSPNYSLGGGARLNAMDGYTPSAYSGGDGGGDDESNPGLDFVENARRLYGNASDSVTPTRASAIEDQVLGRTMNDAGNGYGAGDQLAYNQKDLGNGRSLVSWDPGTEDTPSIRGKSMTDDFVIRQTPNDFRIDAVYEDVAKAFPVDMSNPVEVRELPPVGGGGLLIDPTTGQPSFAYSSRISRMQDDAAQIAAQQANSPSMTAWDGVSGGISTNYYKMGTSVVGMASSGFGMLWGGSMVGLGAGLTGLPEPTTVSKFAGVPLATYGWTVVGKNVLDFGLNLSNFVESFKGTPTDSSSYNPSSSFEYPLRWAGMDDKTAAGVATIFDLGFGYGVEKLKNVRFGQTFEPGVAALLQPTLVTPQTTVLEYTARWSSTPAKALERADNTVFTADWGFKMKENVYDPLKDSWK